MTALLLTERQQEAMWLRYGQKKSIDEIARSLGIGRRAVLTRLRNARSRLKPMEKQITASLSAAEPRAKRRLFAASQISGAGAGRGLQLDDC